MSIQTVSLVGKVKYPIVHKPRLNYKKTELQYSVLVECTQEQLGKLRTKGLTTENSLKLDEEDGKTYLKVISKAADNFGNDTKVFVLDKEGEPVKELIGNGSTANVSVKLVPYGDGNDVCIRLVGIKVLELVKYTPKQVDLVNDEIFGGEVI
jgi:hypothetical protein